MPNWCENKLGVAGPFDEVGAFLSAFGFGNAAPKVSWNPDAPEVSFFEKFLPTPEETLNESKETDGVHMPDWYSWRIENWGTKWDVVRFSLETRFFAADVDGPTQKVPMQVLEFSFDTAWSPPEAGIQAISLMYPNIKFFLYYIEPGMAFEGYSLFQNGQILESDSVTTIIPKIDSFIEDYEYYDRLYSNESEFTNNEKNNS